MDIVTTLISPRRLEPYGNIGEERCLAKYFFNISLCESMYPAFSMFEVVLRNKTDMVLSRHLGPDWIFEIVRRNKKLHEFRNIRNRDVLIETLTMAFWTHLFLMSSRDMIWCRCPNAISEIFEKRRKHVNLGRLSFEMEQIRTFRNSFSHNGSMLIPHSRHYSCVQIRDLMLRLVKEMGGKPILRHLKAIDRFPMMLQLGRDWGYIDF